MILIDTVTIYVYFQENIVKVFNHNYAFRKKIKTSFTVLRKHSMKLRRETFVGKRQTSCMTMFLSRFVAI